MFWEREKGNSQPKITYERLNFDCGLKTGFIAEVSNTKRGFPGRILVS